MRNLRHPEFLRRVRVLVRAGFTAPAVVGVAVLGIVSVFRRTGPHVKLRAASAPFGQLGALFEGNLERKYARLPQERTGNPGEEVREPPPYGRIALVSLSFWGALVPRGTFSSLRSDFFQVSKPYSFSCSFTTA